MTHAARGIDLARASVLIGVAGLLACGLGVAPLLGAQTRTNAPPQPAFEVASVRLIPAKEAGFTSISASGTPRFTARNVTLAVLIAMAWGVDSRLVSGKAPWLDSEQYDVIAKSEGDATISSEQLKPMLKQLLQQRFHLKLHHETRLLQGYALVVAKGGPRLNPAKDDPPHGYVAQGSLRGWNMPLQSLAAMLASPLGRPVVDDTGLKGDFDFKLDYAPDQATDSSLPSIFTAIQEEIGLKLRSQKVPVDALVVDQVDRVPTEN